MGTLESLSSMKIPALCFTGGLATGILMNKLLSTSGMITSKDKRPERWIHVGSVEQLLIYPVKSLPGISVDKAIVTHIGLQDAANPKLVDRSFMVTDSKGNFKHMRIIPKLALISTRFDNDTLFLKNKDGLEIGVSIPVFDGGNRKTVRVWGDKVQAIDCGDKVSEFLSQATNTPGLRLAYHDLDKSQRKMSAEQKQLPMFEKSDTGTFQDETSYMLMTKESVDLLNSKLEKKVSVRNFRPSIYAKDTPGAWAEDFWSYLRIGDDENKSPILKTATPCQRCRLTTIDPDTGEFDEDGEPLKTLTSLSINRPVQNALVKKIVKNSAIMGSSFGMYKNAGVEIQVGDPLYAAYF